jgi:hypothetical protein
LFYLRSCGYQVSYYEIPFCLGIILNVFIFFREPQNEIKYGSVVTIKSSYAKERLLGLRDGIKLGFWRHHPGQGEKWVILKSNYPMNTTTSNIATSTGMIPSSTLGMEDISARGKYARIGDSILIQTYKSDHCLSLVEGTTNSSAHITTGGGSGGMGHQSELRLILKDRLGLGLESWSVEVFGTVPLPSWYQTRPYLNGKYLILPPTMRSTPPEIEGRNFPRSSHLSSFLQNIHSNLFPLNDYSLEDQHDILMREIILLLSGIEGNYIRVAAAMKSLSHTHPTSEMNEEELEHGLKSLHQQMNNNPSAAGGGRTVLSSNAQIILPSLDHIKLVIDIDSADRSSATQVRHSFCS